MTHRYPFARYRQSFTDFLDQLGTDHTRYPDTITRQQRMQGSR